MILECKNLVIGYENRVVLKGINFEINDGEMYVFLAIMAVGNQL